MHNRFLAVFTGKDFLSVIVGFSGKIFYLIVDSRPIFPSKKIEIFNFDMKMSKY
jgi:hypothetical protein